MKVELLAVREACAAMRHCVTGLIAAVKRHPQVRAQMIADSSEERSRVFRLACLRAQSTLHTYGNGYELTNQRKLIHLIDDLRIIIEHVHTVQREVNQDG